MKKAQAFLGALILISTILAPVHASDDSKDITTTEGKETQEGKVYGTLSGKRLKQLKVILPIKIDIAVAPVITMHNADAPKDANRVYSGDYRVKVTSESEVGIQLDNISLKELNNWKLSSKEEVSNLTMDKVTAESIPTAARTISIDIGGKEMVVGNNPFAAGEFVVPISGEKSLDFQAMSGKVWLDKDMPSTTEEAFRIVYTISHKE